MKWGLSILVLCALLAATAPEGGAAEQGGGDAKLLKMVVLSRHGVRSPTQSSETLESWSRKDWPEWPVKRGELTPRGAKLVTAMWEQEAAFLREAGLLPSKGCPEAGTIAVRADRDQRTRVTGEAVLEGLAPGCGFKPIVNETDHPDPLFHPLEAGYCALDPSVVRKEIPVGAIGGLEQSLSGPISELAAILGPASPEFCRKHQLPEGCTVADVPTRLTLAKDNRTVHLDGKLGTASSAAEIMLLEYGQWDHPAGWGAVDKGGVATPAPGAQHGLRRREPRAFRGRRARKRIAAGYGERAYGRYADPAVNKAKVVVFVGHDTNIANIGGMLGLHWQLPGYAPDEIPPASALVLTLWLQNDVYQLRARMIGQSLDTLHDPAMKGEVLRQDIEVPWCGPYEDGKNCTLTDFELRVRDVLRPECVRER